MPLVYLLILGYKTFYNIYKHIFFYEEQDNDYSVLKEDPLLFEYCNREYCKLYNKNVGIIQNKNV